MKTSSKPCFELGHGLANERGSAMLEFVVFGLLAQILILTFATQLLDQQKHQLAVESSSRQAARAATLSANADIGAIAQIVERQQAANFGLAPGRLTVSISPEAPSFGDLVTATATIDGVRAQTRMRVPRS